MFTVSQTVSNVVAILTGLFKKGEQISINLELFAGREDHIRTTNTIASVIGEEKTLAILQRELLRTGNRELDKAKKEEEKAVNDKRNAQVATLVAEGKLTIDEDGNITIVE